MSTMAFGDRAAPSRTAFRGCGLRRALLLAALLAGAGWATQATGAAEAAEAAARAGGELTRLLRFMAAVKGAMALAAAALVWWRLARPAGPCRMAAYLAAAGAAGAGPVLIWSMSHAGLGALLLHGGLIAALATLWRDPAVAARLGEMLEARRRPSGRVSAAAAPGRRGPRPCRFPPTR